MKYKQTSPRPLVSGQRGSGSMLPARLKAVVYSKTNNYRLLPLLLLFIVSSLPVFALNQIQNGEFTADLTGWIQQNPHLRTNPLTSIDISLSANPNSTGYPTQQSLRIYYNIGGGVGSNNIYYPKDCYLQQQFLVPRSTAVRARLTSAHKETLSDADINVVHNGIIFKVGAPEPPEPNEMFYGIDIPSSDSAAANWVPEPVYETVLEAGSSYVARLYFDISMYKNRTATVWVDYITCNVSPSGLIASETATGNCRLAWNISSNPATGAAQINASNSYRIYQSIVSENGPWTQIATRSVNNNFFIATPPANVVYYAVSDVDTTAVESPLSLTATYRTAKLEITRVETNTDNVTKGQNGLPVMVHVTNTGYTAATLNTTELVFSSSNLVLAPPYGVYTIGAPSPSLPRTLAGGESTIITFLVSVASASNSGIDFIDAKVTGTNTQTLAGISDNGSDEKANWLIQGLPNLVLLDIQASSTVYLDQTGVGVYLTVRNDGEAAAVWDLWTGTELIENISFGSYLNQRPYGVTAPYSETIYTGQTKTIRFDIDISPYSATGTATINASMSYVDANTYNPYRYDTGDPTPPTWTIRSGILKTYRGPPQFTAWTYEASSFNQGAFTVYAKGLNLQPDREFRLRWYNPSGTQLASNTAATNLSGELFGSYALTDTSPLGKWRVIVTRISNEIPLSETYFDVVVPASLSATLALPNYATVGQPFNISMLFNNSGGSRIDTAYAAPLSIAGSNSGTANYQSGPSEDFVSVEPYSTNAISWVYQAASIGSFTVLGSGYGVDSNDLRDLTAATTTSNMCVIQAPPVLSVTSVYAAETQVALNQQDLLVTAGVVNTGSAAAWITAANLNFSQGTHYQYLSSPALPYYLAEGMPATLSFIVAVSATSTAPATPTITATFYASDANWASSTYTVNSAMSDSWYIKEITGFCSANNSFSPEQYNFNAGQKVFVKFTGLPFNQTYRVLFSIAGATPDNGYPSAGILNSGAAGTCDSSYTLPAGASGAWKVEIWTCHSSSGQPLTFQSRQFFTVRVPGRIVSSLTFSPNDIELNNTATLTMSLNNPTPNGSTIANIIPSVPLEYSGSTGELLLLTGPQPASATLSTGGSATFTWTFRATAHSGLTGTYRMIATATGNDANLPTLDPNYATSSTSISDILLIRFRDLAYASATLDLGTMVCGQNKTVSNSRVNNLGSTNLLKVSWNKGFFESEDFDMIHPVNLTLYPLAPFTVSADAAASFTMTWASMAMPYNQPAGIYIATMTVFEDMPPAYNGVLDAGEPAYQFSSRVVASECRVVYTSPSLINLGDWNVGEYAATKTIAIYNGGNLALQKLKFKQLAPTPAFTIITTPVTYNNLATNSVLIASISAYIISGPHDDYTVPYTVWDDLNDNGNCDSGEASASFQINLGVGSQLMHFTPNPVDFGNGTPTVALPQRSFLISNIGDRNLSKLKYVSTNLPHEDLPGYYIPYDEIELVLPASITINATGTAYIDMFVPAGTAIGTYSGDIYVFEDEDSDGTYIGDDNEAPSPLTVKVYVNPYRGLTILSATADAGALSALETGLAVITAKNSGNVLLDKLAWEKIALSDGGTNSISEVNYDFEPPTYFMQPFNTIFNATMSLTIPPGQATANYTGAPAWLYDDLWEDGRLIGGDPQVPFTVSCQVGTKELSIIEASLLISDAAPASTSVAATYRLRNTGTLTLNRPMATATALTDGTTTIPATASIFVPSVFDFMIKNKQSDGLWQVQVPAGTPVGIYTGTMTAWNDTNLNSLLDPGEVSDTATLELRVVGKTIIGISPGILEFGYVAPERSASVNFNIVNLGNQPISGTNLLSIASYLPPLAPGPGPIPAANLIFSPVPFGTDLPVGGSLPAVATVTIPAGQSTVTYQGMQRIYVDSVVNGNYDIAEISTTFSARVSVGLKEFWVDDPVNMGAAAHGTTASKSFQLHNSGNISLAKVRHVVGQPITDGTTNLTPVFTPSGVFVAAGNNYDFTVSVAISSYTPAGTYTGLQTAYDDENNDGSRGANEASDTFTLTLQVAASPLLSITDVDPPFPLTVSPGQSIFVNVTYQNTGNVTLSDLSLGSPMVTMNGSEGDTMVPTYSPLSLPALAPGDSYIASITFTARADQATGTYTAIQTLSSTAYPAASVNQNTEVLVAAQTGPKNLSPGTVYQSIATSTFSSGGDFLFSVFVGFEDGFPASATIGLRQDKADDTPANPMQYVTIDQSGTIVSANALTTGIVHRIKSGTKTWYRVYFKLSGALHVDTVATHLILSNSSTNTGTDVWFDGVQLEKANNRTRPTAYGEGAKIISPSNQIDLGGKSRLSDR